MRGSPAIGVRTSAATVAAVVTVAVLGPAPVETAEAADAATAARLRSAAAIDHERVLAAESEPHNWLAHGRTWSEQRFSPLASIRAENVSRLGLGWSFDTGTNRGLEATPIVADGVMFVSGAWSVVWALDARTGEKLWYFDPEVPRAWAANACCDVVNRGVAVWKGRVYVGTIDGRLIALDAGTGEVVWDVNTIDRSRPYTITGAPRIVKGKVLIGNGGAEYGVRGYFSAYDANSGEMSWRFYTVPGDPSKPVESKALERALPTWKGGKWWEVGGGGTVWDSMAYDPELDLLYVGVGNGSPWSRHERSPGGGDNLYLSSILAVRPDSGELVWHYQTTPGDNWDYTATQHIVLANLELRGKPRKVLMQAPKNGFFYVIDRENGQLLSAAKYVKVTWASHVDLETGRPVETAEGDWKDELKLVYPSYLGGHNWHPMSFSPDTGLMYIPAQEIPGAFAPEEFEYEPGASNTASDFGAVTDVPPSDVAGHLLAWDPVAGKEVWRAQHAGPWNGGVLSTAGNLVFQGTADGRFVAYDATHGKPLWQSPAQTGIIAPPISYSVDGEQYVAIVAGWGGAFPLVFGRAAAAAGVESLGRVLTYKLGGKASLPPLRAPASIPDPPPDLASAETIARGEALFHRYCMGCHGIGAVGGGVVADLRHADSATHASWNDIVLGGIRVDKGMASFAAFIGAAQAQDIRAYIIRRAHEGPKPPGAAE